MLFAIVLAAALQATHTELADTVVLGTYRNVDYGFSVHLPRGERGVMAPAPAANHGFTITVTGTAAATVTVESYSSDAAGLREAAEEFMSPLSLADPRLQTSHATLGGLPALRLQFGEGHAPVFHREVFLALRAQKNGGSILYILALRASPPDYERARKVLQALQQSFKLAAVTGA